MRTKVMNLTAPDAIQRDSIHRRLSDVVDMIRRGHVGMAFPMLGPAPAARELFVCCNTCTRVGQYTGSGGRI
eukprot:4997382-Prymnesium_polylepis.1